MRAEVLHEIAAMLDHPNLYMGGPSQRNMRRAEEIYAAVAPLIAAAERERVAKWHDGQTEEATARAEDAKTRGETGNVLHHARSADAHRLSAAAIRALGDEKGDV